MAMQVNYRLNRVHGHFSIRNYIREIGENQKADLAFQANEFLRWDKEQMEAYIKSLLTGRAPSPFIFADVEKCLENAIENDNKADVTYFRGWLKKGVKYLNIDSNNRNNVIVAFMNNEVTIPHGWINFDGASVNIDESCDTYETMPDILREVFLDDELISVVCYNDATREDLSDLFLLVNEGKPLNQFEKLNSYITLTANIIRELSNKHGKYFAAQSKWFNSTARNRRGIDEFIANCAFVYCYGLHKNMSPTSMKDFYRDGSDGEKKMVQFKKIFNSFMKDVATKDAYAIWNRNSIFDLFIIYMSITNEKRAIDDNNSFLKSYIDVISTLLTNGKTYEHEGFKDPKSFDTMVGGRQLSNNIKRNELILELFDYRPLTTKLDPKRGFNPKEKMLMASQGGWITPEDKDIDMSELHTDKYHGGHIKPHSKGGKTDIDNGVIQEDTDNLKLGANELQLEPTD